MKIVDRKFTEENKKEILEAIKNGKIFIYPTDTIYGIGGDATNADSVKKIREIKQRDIKPFSVIAPSMKWIEDNCFLNENSKEQLKKLPGPYTFFLNLKNKKCVSEEVNPLNNSVGIRIPKHWFADFVKESGVPFITTSVNLSGKSFMTKLEDLNNEIKNSVDYIIYEGENAGKESEKIDLR